MREQQTAEGWVLWGVNFVAILNQITYRLVADAVNGNPAIAHLARTASWQPNGADGHLVLGQRSSLVGADNIGAAQGFYRGKLFNQRVAFRHALGAHGQRQGDRREQALRYKRDHHAEREDDALDRVDFCHEKCEDKENKAYPHRNDCHDGGHVLHFLLQRAQLLFHFLCQFCNAAKSRVHAGGIDDSFT